VFSVVSFSPSMRPEPGMLMIESTAVCPSWQDRQVTEFRPGWLTGWVRLPEFSKSYVW
jgi:hypothetical protein